MSTPPPRYGTRKNPTTGKTETYELPPPADLARSRKELADVLHGGGWFEDPLAAPKARPAEDFHGTSPATAEEWMAQQGMHETYPGSGVWVF